MKLSIGLGLACVKVHRSASDRVASGAERRLLGGLHKKEGSSMLQKQYERQPVHKNLGSSSGRYRRMQRKQGGPHVADGVLVSSLSEVGAHARRPTRFNDHCEAGPDVLAAWRHCSSEQVSKVRSDPQSAVVDSERQPAYAVAIETRRMGSEKGGWLSRTDTTTQARR